MPRPKLRNDELRASLLEHALALLEDAGESAFTTRRIAKRAKTSPPAIYELFGDKEGLLRAVFFEGFRMMGADLATIPESDDPRRDLERALFAFRTFALEHPELCTIMFSRPFAALSPDPSEQAAGQSVRRGLIRRVRRCIQHDQLRGDPTDIAHTLLALTMGLATQERAGWLGSSPESLERRWTTGVRALLDGFQPDDTT